MPERKESSVSMPRWVVNAVMGICSAMVVGGVAAMFTAVSWAAKIEEKVHNVEQMASINGAQNLDTIQRLPRIEERVANIDRKLSSLDDKLDKLLERR